MSIPLNQVPAHRVNGSAPSRTNPLAIAAFATSFFIGITGVFLGHIALHQIKRTGEDGRWLAISALVIGYLATVLFAYFLASLLSATS